MMKREGIEHKKFLRYVDDCRLFLPALNKGGMWNGRKFVFHEELTNNTESDNEYTTREITKAMCSVVHFLRFTGEHCDMFGGKLPTLDTTLWMENNRVKFEFFEKPTVGNVVIHRDTALPINSVRASLVQEVVRRLLNCCEDLNLKRKQEIISRFAQKMMNSGHSEKSIKLTIVHGVMKYICKRDDSRLDSSDPNFKPLYFGKEYREEERQVQKQMARANWYKKKGCMGDSRPGWKQLLPKEWRGSSRAQAPLRGMNYSSMIQVPSTKGGILLQRLVTEEDKIARLTGYNVKVVERSGTQLVRLFQRVFSPAVCHWSECPVCSNSDGERSTGCCIRSSML